MNTSQPRTRQESSVYTPIPYANGMHRGSFNRFESTDDTGSSISPNLHETRKRRTIILQKRRKKRRTTSTQECPLQNNQKTSEDNRETLRHPTLGFKYYLTQDPGSTSKGKASKGFFKRSCVDTSERLWYPTETDCAELLSTSSNSSVTSTKLNSWFTTKIRKDPTRRNSWRTSWPSPTFSVPGSMEKDQVSRGNAIQKSAKNVTTTKLLITQLKIMMTSACDQNLAKEVLQQICCRMDKLREFRESTGALSKTQSKQLESLEEAIELFKSGGTIEENPSDLLKLQEELTKDLAEKNLTTEKHVKRAKRIRIVHMDTTTKQTLRKYMTASRKIFNTALDLHNKGFRGEDLRKKCVRGKLIHEALRGIPEHVRQKAFDKFCSSMKSSEELGGTLSFISRNKSEAWVGFQKRDCKIKDAATINIFKNLGMSLSETIDDDIQCDVEVTESFGVFYATITQNRVYLPELPPDILTSRICALDMGERTFGTLYDPDGTIAFLGTDVNSKVKNRLRVIYKRRNGLKTKLSYKKRSRVLRACRRASMKLKNMIKDMHRRVADWLVLNYDVVLIGKLGIGTMKCKRKGKRVLQSLSHYAFRRTLLQKATLARKAVRVVSEAYTTKQCNRCGYMNWTIGSSEVFSCKNCATVCHRDVHSGRGIFIRSLSE